MAPFTSSDNLHNYADIAFCMVAQIMVACELRRNKLKFLDIVILVFSALAEDFVT